MYIFYSFDLFQSPPEGTWMDLDVIIFAITVFCIVNMKSLKFVSNYPRGKNSRGKRSYGGWYNNN